MATTSADNQQSMYEKVEQVNAILLAQEPGNISEDEYSHYTGYKPQSIKDAMNKVFGLGKWGFSELSNEITKDDSGKSIVIAKVKVWIVGVEWEPEAWGQARIMRGDIGDSFKSAETDAMKKGLSNFSIGNRAYLGLLPGKKEQEAQSRTNGNARQQEQVAKPAPQATNTAPRPQARTQPAPVAPAKPAEQKPTNGNGQAKLASIPTFTGLRKATLKYLDEMTFEATLKDFIRDRGIKPDHEFTPDDVVELQKILMPMIREAKAEAAKATPVAS